MKRKSFRTCFQDISTFDAQNPIVGSLLQELDAGKTDIASELIKKAPPHPPGIGYAIQNRLTRLKNNENFNRNNGDENNFQLPLPPPPPLTFNNFIPPLPLQPPPTFNSFLHHLHRLKIFLHLRHCLIILH